MADYNIHYRIAYLRKSGGQTTIDILEKGYIDDSDGDASSAAGPEIIDLLAADDPFQIKKEGDINNIYKPTIGSGATIKVLVQPLSLKNIFTSDPQKFMVKVYNGVSGTNLFWQGFVNTSVYTESYSTPSSLKNEMTIECNNGMVVLEGIPYTQSLGGSNYTGFATIGGVMTNILGKLEIDFTYVRTNQLLTHGVGIYADTTNLFTALKVNNENYYDEGGEPMSCREVIDSIFSAFGWVCFFKGAIVVVLDPLDLQDVYHGHQYDAVPFGANESSLGLGEHLDISSGDISWAKSGGEVDIIQPFNQISITYDPYSFIEGGYDFNGEDNGSVGAVSTEVINNGVTYDVHSQATMANWTLSGPLCYFTALEQKAPTAQEPEFYICMEPEVGATNFFEYTVPYSNIKQDENLMIELSVSVYVNTKHATNLFNPVEAPTVISEIYLYGFKMQIGDKFYSAPHGGGQAWDTQTANTFEIHVREMDAEVFPSYYVHGTWFRKRRYVPSFDTSEVNDKKLTALVYIPISSAYITGLLSGSIKLYIPRLLTANGLTGVKNVYISAINVAIVNRKQTPILNDGVLAKGSISSAIHMKKSELPISLTTGIGTYGVSKGAVSSELKVTTPGVNITGLKRYNTATFYTLNQLLLQSLLSQYGQPRFVLTGTLDVKLLISGLGCDFNLILDSDFLINDDASIKRFYIVGSLYKDRMETLTVTMIEISNAREAIT